MKDIIEKKLCTGCTTCMNICPKKAISFEKNEEGFKYPVIDQSKCINCGLCKKRCPVINKKKNISVNKCYAGYNNDSIERLNSSSGAIFSIIANYVLEDGGIVVGAAFDSNNKLKHVAIDSKNKLDQLKKSKYLQSDLGNIFEYIKEQLKERKVLFVGTPCQVAGLKSFIDSSNLITIDLFCHGVPSPKLFRKYIEEIEHKYNDKLIDYDFRDNCTGWENYSNKAIFRKNEIITNKRNNDYMKLFLSDVALRESCYNCNFKLGNKYSDITLGDFWGIKDIYSEMYMRDGVSAIIINTNVGIRIFDTIKNKITYRECTLNDIIVGNPMLEISTKRPSDRELFFNDLDNKNFHILTKKYVKKDSIIKKFRRKILTKIK